jgi:membrane protease subunit HflC
MSLKNLIGIVLGLLVVLMLYLSFYTVQQYERAVLLRFGAVRVADVPPGLHFKLPIADEVKTTEARVLTVDSDPERYFTLEKKPLIVDSFVKWRVDDVETYYTATGFDDIAARLRIAERVNEGLRNQISRRDMHEVISGERDQLMRELTAQLDIDMRLEFGIRVLDVRVKRIDLPPEVSNAVYNRMNSEREIEAQQHRSAGRELALGINADADRQVVVIGADAYRQAEDIRGDGDARSAGIYAEAFGQDPEFYEFYRSINAYVKVFSSKRDVIVLDPKSDFFKYLERSGGG